MRHLPWVRPQTYRGSRRKYGRFNSVVSTITWARVAQFSAVDRHAARHRGARGARRSSQGGELVVEAAAGASVCGDVYSLGTAESRCVAAAAAAAAAAGRGRAPHAKAPGRGRGSQSRFSAVYSRHDWL